MKCEKCGNDAVYMVAVDGALGSVIKQHVRTYAGRCKTCINEKDLKK
ncbi:hypothetical protein ACFLQI_01525 [Candidatus Undinarchaeota archaeon]